VPIKDEGVVCTDLPRNSLPIVIWKSRSHCTGPQAIPPEPPVANPHDAQRRAAGKGAPVLRGAANPCLRAPLCDPLNSTGGPVGWRPSCW
jgi:hypothetical protein